MQELFKKLAPTVDETLVEFYLSVGEQLVKQYVNNDEIDVTVTYKYQVVQVAVWLSDVDSQLKNSNGVASVSSNGRSMSFRSLAELTGNDIPSHIKAQLHHNVKMW